MSKAFEIYQCNNCGNQVEVVLAGPGNLACCGADMTKLEEKTADAATEKHVPLIEKIDGGYKVTVGSTLHPMEEDHFIQWIELLADGIEYKQLLKPGMVPEATFQVEASTVSAREHCNKHGLWLGK